MKGVYAVFFRLEKDKKIEIGAKGNIHFSPGTYVYIGSAMNGVEKRLQRHFSDKKNKHWHIDYFSTKASPTYWLAFPLNSEYECLLAEACSSINENVDEFGASDCDCKSHLFHIRSK